MFPNASPEPRHSTIESFSETFTPPAHTKRKHSSGSPQPATSKMVSAFALDVHLSSMVRGVQRPFNPRIHSGACPPRYAGFKPLAKATLDAHIDDPEKLAASYEVDKARAHEYKIKDPRKHSSMVIVRDYTCKVPVQLAETERIAQAVLNYFPDQYVSFLEEFVSNLFGKNMRAFLQKQEAGLVKILHDDNKKIQRSFWSAYVNVQGNGYEPGQIRKDADQDCSLTYTKEIYQRLNGVINEGYHGKSLSDQGTGDVWDATPCINQHLKTIRDMIASCKGFGTGEIDALAMMWFASFQGRLYAHNLALMKHPVGGQPDYDKVTLHVPTVPLSSSEELSSWKKDKVDSADCTEECANVQTLMYPVGNWSGSLNLGAVASGLFQTNRSAAYQWGWGHPQNLAFLRVLRTDDMDAVLVWMLPYLKYEHQGGKLSIAGESSSTLLNTKAIAETQEGEPVDITESIFGATVSLPEDLSGHTTTFRPKKIQKVARPHPANKIQEFVERDTLKNTSYGKSVALKNRTKSKRDVQLAIPNPRPPPFLVNIAYDDLKRPVYGGEALSKYFLFEIPYVHTAPGEKRILNHESGLIECHKKMMFEHMPGYKFDYLRKKMVESWQESEHVLRNVSHTYPLLPSQTIETICPRREMQQTQSHAPLKSEHRIVHFNLVEAVCHNRTKNDSFKVELIDAGAFKNNAGLGYKTFGQFSGHRLYCDTKHPSVNDHEEKDIEAIKDMIAADDFNYKASATPYQLISGRVTTLFHKCRKDQFEIFKAQLQNIFALQDATTNMAAAAAAPKSRLAAEFEINMEARRRIFEDLFETDKEADASNSSVSYDAWIRAKHNNDTTVYQMVLKITNVIEQTEASRILHDVMRYHPWLYSVHLRNFHDAANKVRFTPFAYFSDSSKWATTSTFQQELLCIPKGHACYLCELPSPCGPNHYGKNDVIHGTAAPLVSKAGICQDNTLAYLGIGPNICPRLQLLDEQCERNSHEDTLAKIVALRDQLKSIDSGLAMFVMHVDGLFVYKDNEIFHELPELTSSMYPEFGEVVYVLNGAGTYVRNRLSSDQLQQQREDYRSLGRIDKSAKVAEWYYKTCLFRLKHGSLKHQDINPSADFDSLSDEYKHCMYILSRTQVDVQAQFMAQYNYCTSEFWSAFWAEWAVALHRSQTQSPNTFESHFHVAMFRTMKEQNLFLKADVPEPQWDIGEDRKLSYARSILGSFNWDNKTDAQKFYFTVIRNFFSDSEPEYTFALSNFAIQAMTNGEYDSFNANLADGTFSYHLTSDAGQPDYGSPYDAVQKEYPLATAPDIEEVYEETPMDYDRRLWHVVEFANADAFNTWTVSQTGLVAAAEDCNYSIMLKYALLHADSPKFSKGRYLQLYDHTIEDRGIDEPTYVAAQNTHRGYSLPTPTVIELNDGHKEWNKIHEGLTNLYVKIEDRGRIYVCRAKAMRRAKMAARFGDFAYVEKANFYEFHPQVKTDMILNGVKAMAYLPEFSISHKICPDFDSERERANHDDPNHSGVGIPVDGGIARQKANQYLTDHLTYGGGASTDGEISGIVDGRRSVHVSPSMLTWRHEIIGGEEARNPSEIKYHLTDTPFVNAISYDKNSYEQLRRKPYPGIPEGVRTTTEGNQDKCAAALWRFMHHVIRTSNRLSDESEVIKNGWTESSSEELLFSSPHTGYPLLLYSDTANYFSLSGEQQFLSPTGCVLPSDHHILRDFCKKVGNVGRAVASNLSCTSQSDRFRSALDHARISLKNFEISEGMCPTTPLNVKNWADVLETEEDYFLFGMPNKVSGPAGPKEDSGISIGKKESRPVSRSIPGGANYQLEDCYTAYELPFDRPKRLDSPYDGAYEDQSITGDTNSGRTMYYTKGLGHMPPVFPAHDFLMISSGGEPDAPPPARYGSLLFNVNGARPQFFSMLDASASLWRRRSNFNPSTVSSSDDDVSSMHPWCVTLVEAFARAREKYGSNEEDKFEWVRKKHPEKVFSSQYIGSMTNGSWETYFPLLPKTHKLRDLLRRIRALDVMWGELPSYKSSAESGTGVGAWMPLSKLHMDQILHEVGLFDVQYMVPRNPWCAHEGMGLSMIFNQSYNSFYECSGHTDPHFESWVDRMLLHGNMMKTCARQTQYGGSLVEADFVHGKIPLAFCGGALSLATRMEIVERYGMFEPMYLGSKYEDTGLLQDMFSANYRPFAKATNEQREMGPADHVAISNWMAYARVHAIIALSSHNEGGKASKALVTRNLFRTFVDSVRCMGERASDDGIPAIMGFLPQHARGDDRPVVLYAGTLACLNMKLNIFCKSPSNKNERVCELYKLLYLNDATLIYTQLLHKLRRRHRRDLNHEALVKSRDRSKAPSRAAYNEELIDILDFYVDYLHSFVITLFLENGIPLNGLPVNGLVEPREVEVTSSFEDPSIVPSDMMHPGTLETIKNIDFTEEGGVTRSQLAVLSLLPPDKRIFGMFGLRPDAGTFDMAAVQKEIQKSTAQENERRQKNYVQDFLRAQLAKQFLEAEGGLDLGIASDDLQLPEVPTMLNPVLESQKLPRELAATHRNHTSRSRLHAKSSSLANATANNSHLYMTNKDAGKAVRHARAIVEQHALEKGVSMKQAVMEAKGISQQQKQLLYLDPAFRQMMVD